MKKDQLPKILGHKVRLSPPSIHLDMVTGVPRDQRDDIWIVGMNAEKEGLPVRNTYTQPGFTLPNDHIKEYMSDPIGTTKGTLVLKSQVFLQGDNLDSSNHRPTKNP